MPGMFSLTLLTSNDYIALPENENIMRDTLFPARVNRCKVSLNKSDLELLNQRPLVELSEFENLEIIKIETPSSY